VETANTANEGKAEGGGLAFTVVSRDAAGGQAAGEAHRLGSGASATMSDSLDGVIDIQCSPGEVVVANGEVLQSTGSGSAKALVKGVSGRLVPTTVNRVLVVPKLACKQLSVRSTAELGGQVVFKPGKAVIEVGGAKVPARQSGQICEVDLLVDRSGSTKEVASAAVEVDLYHRRFGHWNRSGVRRVEEQGLTPQGLPQRPSPGGKCEVCQVAKRTVPASPSLCPVEQVPLLDWYTWTC